MVYLSFRFYAVLDPEEKALNTWPGPCPLYTSLGNLYQEARQKQQAEVSLCVRQVRCKYQQTALPTPNPIRPPEQSNHILDIDFIKISVSCGSPDMKHSDQRRAS